MKPTSIIFLIVAATLILTGTAMCVIASRQAENDGIPLFESVNEQGDHVERETLAGSAVNRVVVRADHADIHIIGGAESSYLEMVNFSANSYQFTLSGNTVTVGDSLDITDLSSIMNVVSNGFQFGGLRQYIRFGYDDDRAKSINFYVSDTDAIKKFDISVNTGNVTIENLGITADYAVEIGKGDLTVSGTESFSAMTVHIKEGNLSLQSSMADGTLDVTLGRGSAQLTVSQLNSRKVDLIASNGMIRYNGTEKGPSMTLNPLISTASVRVVAEHGDVDFNTEGVYSPVNPDMPENAGTDTAQDTASSTPDTEPNA